MTKFFFVLFCLSIGLHASDPIDAPYYEGTEYAISEKDYADLQIYLQHSKESLEKALWDGRELDGPVLHSRLVRGIQDALAHSQLKAELLLFRYVLTRALEIDRIFRQYAPSGQGEGSAATIVLQPSIKLALKYYVEQDVPRVNKLNISSPDWIPFAIDQISVLMRMANISSSPAAKVEIIRRALGWTARSLNSSIDRRSHSVDLFHLGDALKALNAHPDKQVLTEAQHLLLEIGLELSRPNNSEPIKARSSSNNPTTHDVIFPKDNYPSTDPAVAAAEKANKHFFPIIPGDMGASAFTFQADEKRLKLAALELGGGVTLDQTFTNAASSNPMSYAAVRMRASFMSLSSFSANVGDIPYFIGADLNAAYGANSAERNSSVYNIKVDAWMGMATIPPLGFWAAIDVNQFERFSESLAKITGMAMVPVRISNKDYVLVRLYYGMAVGALNTNSRQVQAVHDKMLGISNGNAGSTYGVSVVLKLAKFYVNIEGSRTFLDDAKNIERLDLAASLTVPLSILFPNDAIKADGRVIRYNANGNDGSEIQYVSTRKLGVYYELQW